MPAPTKDTWLHIYATSMLNATLNHNAAVVQYAAQLLTAGPLKHGAHKKVAKQFSEMHDRYQAICNDLQQQFEKELENAKDN